MAERQHLADGGTIRYTARSERVWLHFYQSWGASITREERVTQTVWWNPFTWFSSSHWEARGNVNPFTVRFLRGDGAIVNDRVNPRVTTGVGYRRVSIVYVFLSAGRGDGLDDLGTDARGVTNVEMEYVLDGETHTLSHS